MTAPLRLSRRILLAAAAAAAFAGPAQAQAPSWPTKPVKIVVPFAAGGSTDVIARLVAQKLGEAWGQNVVVENRTGAGGNVGADMVAKSAADGYTFLLHSGAIAINPHIYAKMPFDTKKDLVPVTNLAGGPMLVVVSAKSEFKSLRDLMTAAKSKPGALTFGSAGVGSQTHLAAESLADAAGVEMVHVPYRGEAPAYADLIAGQTQLVVGNFAAAMPLVGPDRLRALAVTGRERSPQAPDVPTAAESGVAGFENTGWFGLFAPAGTPPAVIARVHRDSVAALADPQIKAKLQGLGMAPIGNSPAEFSNQMDTESRRWAQVVKNRKISAN